MMIQQVMDLVDYHGIMRRPTLDGVRVLLLLLPLLEGMSPHVVPLLPRSYLHYCRCKALRTACHPRQCHVPDSSTLYSCLVKLWWLALVVPRHRRCIYPRPPVLVCIYTGRAINWPSGRPLQSVSYHRLFPYMLLICSTGTQKTTKSFNGRSHSRGTLADCPRHHHLRRCPLAPRRCPCRCPHTSPRLITSWLVPPPSRCKLTRPADEFTPSLRDRELLGERKSIT